MKRIFARNHSDYSRESCNNGKIRKFRVTGYRNKILHMYAYWLGVTHRDEERLTQLVNELNNKFTEPLKQSEVDACT